jgi:hypothetical protein
MRLVQRGNNRCRGDDHVFKTTSEVDHNHSLSSKYRTCDNRANKASCRDHEERWSVVERISISGGDDDDDE